MRWVWDLEQEIPDSPCTEPVATRIIPVRGIFVAAKIMAQTWKGYIDEKGAVEFLKRLLPVGDVYPFVAYIQGRPAGSAVAVRTGPLVEIHGGIHVLPEFRRRYVGTELLVTVLRSMKERGARRVFIVRYLSDPPTQDDVAATRLYDRAQGSRQPLRVELVYTPQCPLGVHYVALVRSWLRGSDAEAREVDFWSDYDRAVTLVGGSSIGDTTQSGLALYCNVVFRVFADGLLVGGCPPRREDVMPELERLGAGGASGGTARGRGEDGGREEGDGREAGRTTGGEEAGPLRLEPLAEGALDASCEICLRQPPSGAIPTREIAEAGRRIRREWLESALRAGSPHGVVAFRGRSPVGVLECWPRGVARRSGWVSGTWGHDDEVFTIACLKVARGEDRKAVMEVLLVECLERLAESRPDAYLETFATYEDPEGPSPYWLYDKYGFRRIEERVPGRSVIVSCRAAGRG